MLLETERAARRAGLELDLERYAARGVLLQDKIGRAHAAIAAAHAALAEAQRLYVANEEESASIRQLLVFDPAVVNTLPIELLQAIWAHLSDMAVSRGRCTSIADETYSAARALLPGRLAAVCRHWRRVALDTPELWTYIALPRACESNMEPDAPLALLLRYVDCQLHRSQQVGLELVLGCDGPPTSFGEEGASVRSSCTLALLRAVVGRAHLWRSVKIQFPPGSAAAFEQLMAGVATPMLEELLISTTEALALPWLASSPHLRILYLPNVPFQLVPNSPALSVTSVSLMVSDTRQDQLWDILRVLPRLKHLGLSLNQSNLVVTTVGAGIRAHALEALTLRGDFRGLERMLTRNFAAPRLKRLNITFDMVGNDRTWGKDFFSAYPDITELELVGTAESPVLARLDALNVMERVRCFSLIDCHLVPPVRSLRAPGYRGSLFVALDIQGDVPSGQTPRLPADIEPAAFVEDSFPFRRSGLVWPELQSVSIVRAYGCEGHLLNQLLSFVRTRTLFNEGCAKPFRLSLLEWPEPFPSWFTHALGYLLGPERVCFTTADGIDYAPVGSEGWDTEQEAESSGADDLDSVSERLFDLELVAGSSEESEAWRGSESVDSSEDSRVSGESG